MVATPKTIHWKQRGIEINLKGFKRTIHEYRSVTCGYGIMCRSGSVGPKSNILSCKMSIED